MAAVITILAFAFLFAKFGKTFREVILGYDVIADIVLTLCFLQLFAATGTISGMMTAIMCGLFVSVALYIGKKTGTSRTFTLHRDGWWFKHTWHVHHGLAYKYRRRAHAQNSRVHS